MTSSNPRLAETFARLAGQGRAALIPYIAAGDPSIASTPALMHALVKAGADIVELGVPFSDPMADGPVIQRASERSIARGTGLGQVLEMVAKFREQDSSTPVVLMGYANPIERMGQRSFAQAAAKAGVDGVLVVDYPPEESRDFAAALGEARVDPIFLLAPTSTDDRIRAMAEIARGYVYYVSLKGVTGAANIDTADVERHLERIRKHVRIPVGVGFGIRDAESACRLAGCADAIIIGSKLIETMENAQREAEQSGLKGEDAAGKAVAAAAAWLGTISKALPARV